jgi:dihydroorotase
MLCHAGSHGTKYDLPLLVHGEVTDSDIDVFDKEKMFIDRILAPLTQRFPRVCASYSSMSQRGMQCSFVSNRHPGKVAATITAHHLLLNRNAIFQGGIHPHHYCLPILKREIHRQALLEAATSGNAKFFLGTDSAPHSQTSKENACGCAGIFTAHAAIELYATAFEQAGALDKLEAFASFYGADFYQLQRNRDSITLHKENWIVPEQLEFAGEKLVPLYAGLSLAWKVA